MGKGKKKNGKPFYKKPAFITTVTVVVIGGIIEGVFGIISPLISPSQTVVSFNQQGGITAGTVNVTGDQIKRSINVSSSLNALREYAGTQVFLHWRADDNESVLFKNNIMEHLSAVGWKVIPSAGHIADESISNVVIEVNHDSLSDDDNSLAAALSLEHILKDSKVAVSMVKREDNPLHANSMYFRIGTMK